MMSDRDQIKYQDPEYHQHIHGLCPHGPGALLRSHAVYPGVSDPGTGGLLSEYRQVQLFPGHHPGGGKTCGVRLGGQLDHFLLGLVAGVGTLCGGLYRPDFPGRSIREFVFASLLAPTLLCALWFAILGGTALNLEPTLSNRCIWDLSEPGGFPRPLHRIGKTGTWPR